MMGLGLITAEADLTRRLGLESFFVKLLREYEFTVQSWARHELMMDLEWSDPRLSRQLLERLRIADETDV